MSGPVLAVRVAANVEELKRNLQDGVVNQVEVVKRSLQSMVAAYDPQALINKAGATAAAIQQIGGASMLSAEQQTRATRAIDEGIAAYERMGKSAPAGLQALKVALDPAIQQQNMLGEKVTITAAQMEQATGKTLGLRTAYREFDNVLQAVGINIGPQAKGILDIAEAAGHTTSTLGPLATAGLAAGAAFAGWQIGRWIADITHADEAIAHMAATLLGYGNTAAEVAGAKQDAINRAIANGAAVTISYVDAIKFNIDAEQRRGDMYVVSGQKMADAWKEVRNLSEATREEILRAKDAGATQEQLHRVYGISADALKILVHQKELATAASEKLKKAHDEEAAAQARLTAENKKDEQMMLAQLANLNTLAKIKADHIDLDEKRRPVTNALRDAIYESARVTTEAAKADQAFAKEQAALDAENRKLAESFNVAGKAAADSGATASSAYKGVQQQVTITGEAVKEWLRLQVYSAKVNAILSEGGTFNTQSQRDRIAALGIPEFAGSSGGGSSSTSNVTFAPVINVTGGGNSQDTARAVSDALLNLYRSGAIPFPSPV